LRPAHEPARRTIPTGEVPGLAPLVRDFLTRPEKVAAFYSGDFRDPQAFADQAERVTARRLPRERLASVLAAQNRLYGCGPATLANIDRLAADGSCAVVTGQQVGLFSGPLYTVYKALTAVKLAARLDRDRAAPFVPVFWLASEDSDLDEIDHIALLDLENRLEEVRCRPDSAAAGELPAWKVRLDAGVGRGLERLGEMMRDSEFKPDVLAGLREDYAPGRSFAEAFGRWMTRLFGARGLVFIDPSHPDLKALGRDVFRREIAGDSPSTRQALETSRRLALANYEPHLRLHEGILNLFLAPEDRRTIQVSPDGFLVRGMEGEVGREALLRQVEESPDLFSANVLLRPIYQDALLPTVSYVAGPGEIGYFGQMKGVYESFGLPMPVIQPRKSVTLLEDHIGGILAEFRLEIGDIWSRGEGAGREALKDRLPRSLTEALGRAAGDLARDMDEVGREIRDFEPGLENSLEAARGKIGRQLDFLEEKILQAARKRERLASGRLEKAVNHLYPGRRLQERVFNIVPYLVGYGPAVLDTIYRDLDIGDPGHQVITP